MKKQDLLDLFFQDVKDELRTEHNYWNNTHTLISSKVNDIVYQCEVDYYMCHDELEIIRIYNIEVIQAERENNFENIIKFLNKVLC